MELNHNLFCRYNIKIPLYSHFRVAIVTLNCVILVIPGSWNVLSRVTVLDGTKLDVAISKHNVECITLYS